MQNYKCICHVDVYIYTCMRWEARGSRLWRGTSFPVGHTHTHCLSVWVRLSVSVRWRERVGECVCVRERETAPARAVAMCVCVCVWHAPSFLCAVPSQVSLRLHQHQVGESSAVAGKTFIGVNICIYVHIQTNESRNMYITCTYAFARFPAAVMHTLSSLSSLSSSSSRYPSPVWNARLMLITPPPPKPHHPPDTHNSDGAATIRHL